MLRQCRFPRPVLFSLVHIKLFFLFYDHFFVSFLVKREEEEEEEEENSLADRRAYYWQMDGTERWRCRRTRIVVEEDEEAPRREGSKVQGTPRRVGSLWGARGHVDSKCPIDMLQWFFSICTGRETEGQQWGVSCWNIWLGSKFKSLFVKKKRISGLSKSYNPKLNSRVLSPLLKKYLMDNQKNSPPWEMRSNRWNQNFFFFLPWWGERKSMWISDYTHKQWWARVIVQIFATTCEGKRERERGDICTRHHMWTVYPVCTCVLLVFRLLGRDTLPDFQGSFSPLAPHSQELLQEDTADTQKSWSNRKSFRFLVCNHQCFLFAVPLSFYQFTVSDDFWWICPFHWIYYNSWGRKTEGPNRKIPQSFAVYISIDFHRDSFVSFFLLQTTPSAALTSRLCL